MLLVASADRGTADVQSVLSSTWAAGVLLVDARGNVTGRGLRGTVYVEACQAAALDLAYHGKDFVKARAAGAAFAANQAPQQLSGDRLLLSVWMRERMRTIKNHLGVSILDGGFASIPMAYFSPDGWFKANPSSMPPNPSLCAFVACDGG